MTHAPIPLETNALATSIIGAAIYVHRCLGPGLLESTYEEAMQVELDRRGHVVETQVAVPVLFRDTRLATALRLDMRVDQRVIVELKSVETLRPIHSAQVLTYLRFSGCRLGLLMNFNVPIMKSGIRRIVL